MHTRAELLERAWVTGNLEFQVRDYQLPIYNALWKAIRNKGTLKYCLNIARRFGKTHIVTLVAIEFAIRFPGSSINYASGTDKAMRKILRAIFPVILETCPVSLRPKQAGGVMTFPNGSVIYTAGVNNQHADDLRGTSSHLNLVDEAGMIDELQYLVQSVLMPQQLTVDGTMILMSTPPPEVDHDYTKIYHECAEEGAVMTFTIHQNDVVMSDPVKFASYAKEAGGEGSTTWRREYLCEFVTDSNKIIMPEWAEVKSRCVIPPMKSRLQRYFLKYVGMDLGFRDHTCLIFGHADFLRQKVVIEGEKILKGEDVTSKAIAQTTTEMEEALWGPKQNVMRISDNSDLIVLNDVLKTHNVAFNATSKDSLDAMVSQTRLFIQAGKLEISPECTYLLGCLEFGVWNKHRDAFATSKTYGHYDGLAALIYMLRYVDLEYNPVPKNLDIAAPDLLLPIEDFSPSQSNQGLRGWATQTRSRLNSPARKGQ